MSELIVISYENRELAEDARWDLFHMSYEYLAHVVDAVVATMDRKGRVHLHQNVDLWFTAAGIGSFIGVIVGAFFLHPLAGAAIGGATAGLFGAFQDYGIDDDFMREVAGELEGGRAALFMLIRTEASDRVIERLATHGGNVLRTNLSHEQELALRQALAKAHKHEIAPGGSRDAEAA